MFFLTLLIMTSFIPIPTRLDTTLIDTLTIFEVGDSTFSHIGLRLSLDELDESTQSHIPVGKNTYSFPLVFPDSLKDALFIPFRKIENRENELFPLSAVVKIYTTTNDTLQSWCSGMMVSDIHVLTATHCLASGGSSFLTLFRHLEFTTGYHSGFYLDSPSSSIAKRFYLMKKSLSESIFKYDIAVVELKNPLGIKSGWIGIQSFEHTGFYEQFLYSFGYPVRTSLIDSSKTFTGTEMYFGFGYPEKEPGEQRESKIFVVPTEVFGGQSGSSIFSISGDENFLSHGVPSYVTKKDDKVISYARGISNIEFGLFSKVISKQPLTSIDDEDIGIPNAILLYQNYPNPFNPTTIISFTLKQIERVSLNIYDVSGRLASVLIDEKKLSSGLHEIEFNASGLSSGIYFYQLRTYSTIITKKMTLIK